MKQKQLLKTSFALLAMLVSLPFIANAEQVGQVEINETNFPDEAFRTMVKTYYSKEENLLDEDKIAKVTWLNVSGKQISNLKGIEHFTSLVQLYCYNNNLTELDLSKNTALKCLSCQNNQLTSLNLEANENLEYLYCYSNSISSLDLSQNEALIYLACYGNEMTDLTLSTHTNLSYLDCHSNKLSVLNLEGSTALTSLSCYDNQLSDLDVSNHEKLIQLFCYKNQLKDLNVSKCTALNYLSCYSNDIQGDDMDNLIESLPEHNGESANYTIRVYSTDDDEKNVCTRQQVKAAKAKGWIVKEANGTEYTGLLATAEVEITNAEYTTYVTTFDVDFTKTDGLTAYIVKEATMNGAILEEIESAPAGTAVILNGSEGKYNILETEKDEVEEITDNQFKAGGEKQGDGSTIYALGYKNNVVGFYLVKNGTTIPKNKGYIEITETPTSKTSEYIPLGNGTTGINDIEKKADATTNAVFYNLAGQQVVEPLQSGLYIVNGKKVIINKK